jgi:hypothetical protein
LDDKSKVNKVYKAAVRVLLVQIRLMVMVRVRARVRVRVRVKIKVILYRLKDFVGVCVGKAMRGRYRYLSNCYGTGRKRQLW